MAVLGSSGVSLDAYADILTSWVEKCAENTARIRDEMESMARGVRPGGGRISAQPAQVAVRRQHHARAAGRRSRELANYR